MLCIEDERSLKLLLKYRRRVLKIADRIESNVRADDGYLNGVELCDYGQSQIAPVLRAMFALLLDGDAEDFQRLTGDRVLFLSGNGV